MNANEDIVRFRWMKKRDMGVVMVLNEFFLECVEDTADDWGYATKGVLDIRCCMCLFEVLTVGGSQLNLRMFCVYKVWLPVCRQCGG